jgi:hypothetical protein
MFYLGTSVHNLTLGLLRTDHLANGEQLNAIQAVTETYVAERTYFLRKDNPKLRNPTDAVKAKAFLV